MFEFSKGVSIMKPGGIRKIAKHRYEPGMISFTSGMPASDFFPVDDIITAFTAMMHDTGKAALQYGSTAGYPRLKEQVCERMARKNNIIAKPENIHMLVGSQQGIDSCAKLFINPGDVILVEAPSYSGALDAFRPYMPVFVEVPTDENGPVIPELRKILETTKNVKFMYAIPEFQNPTGHTWSLDVRRQFMELVSEFEFPVVEDNPYGELRFKGEPLPTLKSMDDKGLVIYLGSFSKILSPGIRVAWMCAATEIIEKIELIVSANVLQAPTILNMLVSKYLDMYDLDAHIEKVFPVYRKRCDLMLDAMHGSFPAEAKFSKPEGGLFIWVDLPERIDTDALSIKGIEKKVLFVPGIGFFPNRNNNHCLRLNFSLATEAEIEDGISRLAELIKEAL